MKSYTILIGLIDPNAPFHYNVNGTVWTGTCVFIWKGSSREKDNMNLYYYNELGRLTHTHYKNTTLPQRRNFFACLYSSPYKTI
jgi:hypothetical protein